MKRLISERTVEQLFGLSRRRLQKWRHEKAGPPWYKIGRSCRYLAEEVETFIRSSRVEPKKSSETSMEDSK
jgi:predicted DNA-binding transcriptional regulator AlpA